MATNPEFARRFAPQFTHKPSVSSLAVNITNPNKAAADSKTAEDSLYAAKYKKSQQLLTALDNRTAELLVTACCTEEQTTQFWHYMVSKPCLSQSVCETVDIPSSNSWGGWHQSTFLTLYSRALLETITRITNNDDTSLPTSLLPILKTEFMIAKVAYQSAKDRESLEAAKQNLDGQKKQLEHLLKLQAENNNRLLVLNQQHTLIEHNFRAHNAQLHTLSAEYQQHFKTYNNALSSIRNYDTFFKENPNFIPTAGAHKEYQANCKTRDTLYTTLLAIQKDHQDCLNQRKSAHDQLIDLGSRREDQLKFAKLIKEKQDAIKSAEAQFEAINNLCINKLLANIQRLKPGENYCHAAGFQGHAIYINFENIDGVIKAKICNLGAASDRHPHLVSDPNLTLPMIIQFAKNAQGKKDLAKFCQNITAAITQPEKEAAELLYRSNCGIPLTAQQYSELHPAKVSAEVQQTTGNCTAKGYFHSLRERIGNISVYRRLMLSLFTWSKNAYFLRNHLQEMSNSLPVNVDAMITKEDLEFLTTSESAFKDVNFETVKNHISTHYLSGLMFAPALQLQTTATLQTVAVATGSAQAAASNNAYYQGPQYDHPTNPTLLLYGYGGAVQPYNGDEYFGLDSQVNASKFSEDELSDMLRGNTLKG